MRHFVAVELREAVHVAGCVFVMPLTPLRAQTHIRLRRKNGLG